MVESGNWPHTSLKGTHITCLPPSDAQFERQQVVLTVSKQRVAAEVEKMYPKKLYPLYSALIM